jgi:sigma-E factor negative regulatory protein RseB
MSEHGKQAMSMSQMPVDHMVFTDGLAMVSVFIEKLSKNPQVTEGPSRMGGINTFAILNKGYQVTAVGEVPRSTVKLMANSVKLME